jgi:crotonobetainyl-CoA:carnitine CoA-transferase CaiB-like acyl-CoA transferase
VWECAEGKYLCTTDMEPAYWQRFCAAVGKPEFAALQQDKAQHPRMEAELADLFRTRPRDEWVDLLFAADTQAMPVLSGEEALEHPHNRARGMVVDVPVEGQEPVRHLGLPFLFSETMPREPRVAGMAGADTSAILAELGFNEDALRAAGAFDADKPA